MDAHRFHLQSQFAGADAAEVQEIAEGRTVLVVAHRLSTVRATDRIVTLERGRLVEDGTHDALIKTGGRYASLHRLQAGLHEVG